MTLFPPPAGVGNVEDFSDRLRSLHHTFLELTLRATSAPIPDDDLVTLYRAADFLATYYTNPFFDARNPGMSIDKRPSPQILQDGRNLAGTIYEFLGDYKALHDQDETSPLIRAAYSQALPPSDRLFLKAALMYSLGLFESRTRVILSRVVRRFTLPAQVTVSNIEQLANALIMLVLSGQIARARGYRGLNPETVSEIRSELRREADVAIRGMEQPSGAVRRMVGLEIALASQQMARALSDGNISAFDQAIEMLNAAAKRSELLREPETLWTIHTLNDVFQRLWQDSPWTRLSGVIRSRRYLAGLVESGVTTLWSSQIAALELSSDIQDLRGGYLDQRLKRIVISMPTSAGKTLLAELAIVKLFEDTGNAKCVYVAPTRALCEQISSKLRERLAPLNIRVVMPISDNDTASYEPLLYADASIIVVTQEKLSYLIRQNSPAVIGAGLFVYDEIHTIGKTGGRGWAYEEVVTLLMSLPGTRDAKMLFLSAIMPNHIEVREWIDPEGVAQSIATEWQPTRTLKGALVFDRTVPRANLSEVTLPGDIVYVRRQSDLASPLKLKSLVQSRQVLENHTTKNGWTYQKRVAAESDGAAEHAAKLALIFKRLGPVLIYAPIHKLVQEVLAALLSMELVEEPQRTPTPREDDAIQFVSDILSSNHPVTKAILRRVGVHHALLPRDVRPLVLALDETTSPS